jgi:hypothetical protein
MAYTDMPPRALLLQMTQRWQELDVPVPSPWPGIAAMMQSGYPFFEPSASEYFFFHGDLFAHNIMVQILGDKIATVTAVLDWDNAHFAPPAWLWVEEYWAEEGGMVGEEELWTMGLETPLEPGGADT